MSTKWRGKGSEEGRECDGRTVLREIYKKWVEDGEQQEESGVGDC